MQARESNSIVITIITMHSRVEAFGNDCRRVGPVVGHRIATREVGRPLVGRPRVFCRRDMQRW